MASKRKQNFDLSDSDVFKKKHTLDSDEEDSDDYERDNLNDSDIEGGEEGVGKVEDDVKITPFNMREELEEGHFDKEGHYHWNKEAQIKDNWLDNIDWVKVEKDKNYFDPNNEENSADGSLPPKPFNQSMAFTKMLEFMKPGETVQMALQRLGLGTNVSTTFITCPADPKKTLGIKLPFLVMIIKNMKKYFTFEVQVLDDKNVRRRFRASNYQSTTRVKPFICTMPMRLDEGWNQIQFNLSDFTRRAYGTNYVETLRVQIHANCRIRRVYFSDRLYSEDELPPEFKLFLPIQKPVQKSNAICS
ncbi:hypothetical protein AWZ03_006303 [Drosophila navojoa]|uniref:CFA20 domain-containing protein n=1 Tax=Drosophila navojoa TaxID=7232 RepID=A0A484BGZ8_DRONA|nr:hypothetical protein AWZ03_006303 [Drosophila navojoa]